MGTSRIDGVQVISLDSTASGFAGQVALVTGAGSGIGLATCRAFAEAGADTYGLVQTDGDIPSSHVSGTGAVNWLIGDVRDRDAIDRAFSTVRKHHGKLDVLVSNAGVARHGRIPDLAVEDIELMISTNLAGFFNVMALGIPMLRAGGGGAVVAVSSVHAIATSPLASVYAATKAGIVAAVRSAALDHAPDRIRVNAVLPGSVDTPMLRASAARRFPDDPERAIREWGAIHPIGRVLTAEEVASSILFLAGPAASGITGSVLAVDGGLLARLAL